MDEDGPDDRRPTFEHVVPSSKGGTDSIDDLVIACVGCNHSRGNGEAWAPC